MNSGTSWHAWRAAGATGVHSLYRGLSSRLRILRGRARLLELGLLACGIIGGLTLTPTAAHGQVMYGDPCCCPAPCGPSFLNPCARPCACAIPVAQPQPIAIPQVSYQQVPTTEYRAVRQTVQRPVVETAMVDQPVTEYRTVYETQTAQVPQTMYQNVTEYRTVSRDCGRWQTNYICRPQTSACDYDSSAGLLGSLNRTAYNVRMAFTPKVYAQRSWVSNIQTAQVPVTRQVAVQTMRTVAYQVPKTVAYTSSRKVAVNTVRMVAQEITVQQPVTVMKTVPVTTTAYAWGYPGMVGGTATATAIAPIPDPGVSTAIRPRTVIEARGPTPANPTPAAPARSAKLPESLNEGADDFKTNNGAAAPPKTSSRAPRTFDDEGSVPVEDARPERSVTSEAQVAMKVPTAMRVGRWTARRTARPTTSPDQGPALSPDAIVAQSSKTTRTPR